MDNLPFRRLRGTASGTKEIRVGLDGDRFVEHLDDPPDEVFALADGEEAVLPEGATAFIDAVVARLAHPGYALLIDYGGVGEPGGSPHGYRAHRPVADLLERPGETDITCGLDFDLISEHAEKQGPDRVPERHAAPRAHRAGLRRLDPRAAPPAGRTAGSSRGARRRPNVERKEPGHAPRRPFGARPAPLVPPRDAGPACAPVDVSGRSQRGSRPSRPRHRIRRRGTATRGSRP